MIKLSKLTDYAVVVLAQMALSRDTLHSAVFLAEKTGLPEPTVAKVLKLLARGGIIVSTRGANGGYKLAAAPEATSMAAIITALDGPIALTACVHGSDECCTHAVACPVKGQWNPVNEAMKNALESVSLSQMIKQQDASA